MEIINKIKKGIESKRNSQEFLWKNIIAIKDLVWKTYSKIKEIIWITKIKTKASLSKGKLPDFIIIGATKCGTSSLYANLKLHPQIEMSPNFLDKYPSGNKNTKEVRFFSDSRYFNRGIVWYKSLFNKNNKLQGEATPEYIFQISCHKKMKEIIPKAKLILLLRDPVKRAYSHYNHMKQEKWNSFSWDKSFEWNIKKEIESNFKFGELIKKGLYLYQIKNLLKYYSRSKLLIIISEEMEKEPQKVYDKISRFLGIKESSIKYIPNVHKRTYQNKMKKTTEKKLYQFYAPFNKELFKFLGKDIPEWKTK